MIRARMAAVALLLLAGALGAQPAPVVFFRFDPAEAPSDLTLTRSILARMLPAAPVIDGRLDDEVWRQASTLGPLSRVGSAEPAPVETQLSVGHFKGTLYVGIQCYEADRGRRWRREIVGRDAQSMTDDGIALLFNARNDRAGLSVVVVSPLGGTATYRTAGGQKDVGWRPEMQVRCAENEFGWAVELALPRAALETPGNDVIGFNVVRRRPGTAGEPFAWNPAPAAFEQGAYLGLLCFETRPCAIQKVEVGWPHAGRNRVRVMIRNDGDQDQKVRVGLSTRRSPTSADRSRYRFTVPRGQAVQYGFTHRIGTAAPCDLEFVLTEEESNRVIARFTRPGLAVAAGALALEKPEVDDRTVGVRFALNMPRQEYAGGVLTAAVREAGSLRQVAVGAAGVIPARAGLIRILAPGLPPGDYQVHVWLTRDGEVQARALQDLKLDAASAAPTEKADAQAP